MTLSELNALSSEDAESRFRDCCGSQEWARQMAEFRPFPNEAFLLDEAQKLWWNLSAEDWLEAFTAHPKIGDKKAAPKQQDRSAEWSKGEQSGMDTAADGAREELAEAN